jgi:peptidoglycan/LPS O-acetylase OafA/YrhL
MSDFALFFWMVGVSAAHAARFGLFDDPKVRRFVAGAGVVIYAVAAGGALLAPELAYWIAVVFPSLGVATVLLSGQKVDDWQLAVGFTQAGALVYSLGRLTGFY